MSGWYLSKARMICGRAITMLWSCGSITPDRNTGVSMVFHPTLCLCNAGNGCLPMSRILHVYDCLCQEGVARGWWWHPTETCPISEKGSHLRVKAMRWSVVQAGRCQKGINPDTVHAWLKTTSHHCACDRELLMRLDLAQAPSHYPWEWKTGVKHKTPEAPVVP